jgi:hypothetical protein
LFAIALTAAAKYPTAHGQSGNSQNGSTLQGDARTPLPAYYFSILIMRVVVAPQSSQVYGTSQEFRIN